MRKPLKLDLTESFDRLAVLVHGPYGAGKTRLQGDFLQWVLSKGMKGAFINVTGEDGADSIKGLGLGGKVHAETVETFEDFEAAMADLAAGKVGGVAIDSLPAFSRLVFKSFLGSVRYPDPKIDGERAKMLWGQIKLRTFNGVMLSRASVPYVFWVSAYDKSEDIVKGDKFITPDMPGQQALGCAGWFDMVGYLSAEATSPKTVRRTLHIATNEKLLTRQRLPKAITADIPIPEGSGGWANIITAIQNSFKEEA